MRQIIINEDTRYLLIGYESENNVTQVVFPYDESWLSCGDGEFKIRVLRNCDTNAYNATNVIDNREAKTLTMTITDIELSVEGPGEFQICYICGNTIKKSRIYRYIVNRAIDSEIVDPPQGSIINEVIQSLAELRTGFNNLTSSMTELETDFGSLTSQVGEIEDSVGDLSGLETQNKDDLVSAINEIGNKTIEVDSKLSLNSLNPVQNKTIKQELNGLTTVFNMRFENKADKTVATSSSDGLMSAQDKTTLDAVAEDYSSALVALGVINNG